MVSTCSKDAASLSVFLHEGAAGLHTGEDGEGNIFWRRRCRKADVIKSSSSAWRRRGERGKRLRWEPETGERLMGKSGGGGGGGGGSGDLLDQVPEVGDVGGDESGRWRETVGRFLSAFGRLVSELWSVDGGWARTLGDDRLIGGAGRPTVESCRVEGLALNRGVVFCHLERGGGERVWGGRRKERSGAYLKFNGYHSFLG